MKRDDLTTEVHVTLGMDRRFWLEVGGREGLNSGDKRPSGNISELGKSLNSPFKLVLVEFHYDTSASWLETSGNHLQASSVFVTDIVMGALRTFEVSLILFRAPITSVNSMLSCTGSTSPASTW